MSFSLPSWYDVNLSHLVAARDKETLNLGELNFDFCLSLIWTALLVELDFCRFSDWEVEEHHFKSVLDILMEESENNT